MKKFTTCAQAKRDNKLSYLGNTAISMKLKKNIKVNGIKTYCIYLSPASSSGHNICPFASIECELGCLATSGRVKMETNSKRVISDARLKKTLLYINNPDYFWSWVVAEIELAKQLAEKQGYGFAVRFNGTSDIDLTKVLINGKTLFELFPDVTMYDYTKNVGKFMNAPKNYHLTFSYSGRNEDSAKMLLKAGHNIAVVFNVQKGKELPKSFLGYKVIDGDLTDLRYADPKNVIVGLRWKNIKDKAINEKIKNSVFVVQPTDSRCTL